MTVLRLRNGDLFVHSPIAFDAALADDLGSIGRMRHLISPNQFHYAHIGEWSRAFPDALTWASPGVRRRALARGIDVQFTRDLGSSAPEDWQDEVDQTAVPGGIFGEIVFFHKRSRTLILTDTILNLELDKASAALAVRHQDDRDVLPTGPNLLWHVVADALAKKKNESRCAHVPCVAAGAHRSGPRALLRIERQRDPAARIRLGAVAELGRRLI